MLGAVEHLQRATQANGEVDSEPGRRRGTVTWIG